MEKKGKIPEKRKDISHRKGNIRGCKQRSKIVQVKGVMPLWGGLTRQTPTGRAVGRFVVWHNFFGKIKKVMPVFLGTAEGKGIGGGRKLCLLQKARANVYRQKKKIGRKE